MKYLVFLLTIIFGIQASAATVYDGGAPSATDGQRSDFDNGKQIGGQFTLTTTQTLRSIEWWGVYGFSNTPQSVDAFTVQIFAVTAGAPEATPAFQYSLSAVPRVATGAKIAGSLSIYRYISEIPATVLAPGTYVLSIMNDTTADTNDSWYWADSAVTAGPAWERNTALLPWYNIRDGAPPTSTPNIAFNISDTGIAPTLSAVTIASNNATPSRAKAGNVITVNFTASEPLQTPTVTLAGRAATVANPSGNNWTATITVAAGDTQGAAAFSIVFKDLANNSGTTATATTNSSTVTIDTIAPAIAAHANVTAEATSAAGATVTYAAATATDGGPGTVTIGYSKASGAVFALGATTVTVTATDGTGNSATGTFGVTVQDTTAPTIVPPANINVNATSASGMVVNYSAATITDAVGVTSFSYSKASGTVFPSGTTAVSITASDAAGNSRNASFNVTVNSPPAGGTFSVTPSTGIQQGTSLTLSAAGWTDSQTPLTYQFFLGAGSLGAASTASTLNLAAPAPGTYTLSVRVTDALGAFADGTQSLTVQAGISSWRQTHFGTTSNTGNAADDADPNGNGVANLFEYAFHGDPVGSTVGPDLRPNVGKSAGNALQLSFTRYLDRADLTLSVEAADLPNGPWTTLATSVGGAAFVPVAVGATAVETGTGASRNVAVADVFTVTNAAHPRRYLRLNVTR